MGLRRDLDEARKVIAEGETLEPVLRQRIEELEEDNKGLKVTNRLLRFTIYNILYVAW